MINYAIPGVYSHFELNVNLIHLIKDHPEFFYDNIGIDAVFGIFPFCIMDGGRIFNEYVHLTKEEVEYIVKTYNDLSTPVRLVYTNTQLDPSLYNDRWSNIVLKIVENDINQIVVSDDNFQKYVRENYPKFSFISSTTKCLNLADFKEELKKDAYLEVCLDYNLNSNLKMLNELTEQEREKCEFLINAICAPGCQNRKEHYKFNSLYHINQGMNFHMIYCPITDNTVSPTNCAYRNNLSYEDIVKNYEPLGFKHFKLEGRTLSDLEVAANYIKYMVKPEYKEYVLTRIMPEKAMNKGVLHQ